MVRIVGAEKHAARLKAMASDQMVKDVGAALYAGGNLIQTDAQISITSGAISGKGHIPSKPGEPPKNDTGTLADGIETALVEPLKVEVSSNAPYAAALEFGTSRMSERPYLRPATQKNREKVIEGVAEAVRRTTAKNAP